MARVTDTEDKPGKPRIYEVVVKNQTPLKQGGWKITYTHTIKYPGWEEFFNPPER